GQPGDRLGRVERALPLATHLGRDPAAEVVDEGQGCVPVGAGDVDGREALLAELLVELLRICREFTEALRSGLDPRLPEQVGAVGDDAGAGVVRHPVELPAVTTGRREAFEPGARVVERRLARGDVLER